MYSCRVRECKGKEKWFCGWPDCENGQWRGPQQAVKL
jgi:hypothetical protein